MSGRQWQEASIHDIHLCGLDELLCQSGISSGRPTAVSRELFELFDPVSSTARAVMSATARRAAVASSPPPSSPSESLAQMASSSASPSRSCANANAGAARLDGSARESNDSAALAEGASEWLERAAMTMGFEMAAERSENIHSAANVSKGVRPLGYEYSAPRSRRSVGPISLNFFVLEHTFF
jgi:hypothetical protein